MSLVKSLHLDLFVLMEKMSAPLQETISARYHRNCNCLLVRSILNSGPFREVVRIAKIRLGLTNAFVSLVMNALVSLVFFNG